MVEPDTRLVSLMQGGCQCCGAALVGGSGLVGGDRYCVDQRPSYRCVGYKNKENDERKPAGEWEEVYDRDTGHVLARKYQVDGRTVRPDSSNYTYKGKYSSAAEGRKKSLEAFAAQREKASKAAKAKKHRELSPPLINAREESPPPTRTRSKYVREESPPPVSTRYRSESPPPVRNRGAYQRPSSGSALVGGKYKKKGSCANSNNPWQNFLRAFAKKHPKLAHDRAALVQAASPEYRKHMGKCK